MSNSKFQIIPAILATTEVDYKAKLDRIRTCPELVEGWVQIDLMDNKFVQNRSIEPQIIAKYPTNFKLEAHLMVEDPMSWTTKLVKINNIKRIIFHIEIEEDIEKIVQIVRGHGIEVGLAINPETTLEKLNPFISEIDVVLIPGVRPGFQGQEFIPETIYKIKECFRLRSNNNRHFRIEVDGGISKENIKEIVDAGADYLVIGSGLFKYDNLKEGLKKIKEAIYG